MDLDLSDDQKQALDTLLDWYKSKDKTPFITLGGYAGTGKTTLMAFLRRELEKVKGSTKVAFCSYTGKATQVLRKKLHAHKATFPLDEVRTIHSLIYKAITNESGAILGWQLRSKGEVNFDLIIVDEASMVDENIWNDLLSYDIPIIAVGDHGQLPPINGTFNLMENPQIRLERIHRQAAYNPIIRLSVMAREIGNIPKGSYGENVKKLSMDEAVPMLDNIFRNFNDNYMILCGYNSTRVKINSTVRDSLGFESPTPTIGDRVICLRNNWEKEIFNGMLGTIKEIKKLDGIKYETEIAMESFEEGAMYKGCISTEQFFSSRTLNNINGIIRTKDVDLFDFGYALTVH
ncbi:MAG: hypothetical protein UW65_C0029G0001, partial [candidate division WWE3 bacterium GW2011_GWB1_44_4]